MTKEESMAREIKKVAVLGAGVMGMGIAAHLANAGIPCLLLDIVPPNLTDEEKKSKANRDRFAAGALQKAVKVRGQIRPFMKASLGELVEVGNFDDDLGKVADCDWIVEVVVERLDIKRALFDKLIKVRKEGSIVTSNTSGIKIADIVEGYPEEFQQNFMITHFFNPPRYLRLLELVAGEKTAPEVVETMADFGSKLLGKGIVYGKDTPNFVANRIGVMGIMSTVKNMMEMGLTAEEVDVITGSPMGHPKSATFRTADLVGLDTLGHLLTNNYASLPDDEMRELYKAPEWFTKMIENNWLGNKTRQGFYKKEKVDGKRKVYQLDYNTMEYVDTTRPKFDVIKKCKNIDDPGERVKALIADEGKAGKFAWALIAEGCVYAANRLGEIADDIVQIDNGMKWGFAWERGPFELWDAIGVKESIARMEADGYTVPAVAKTMAEKSEGTWYVIRDGKEFYWDFNTNKYVPVNKTEYDVSLNLERDAGKVLKSNSSATLIDLGDGIMCCDFHSKMNAIDDDIIKMLLEGADMLDSGDTWKGMVVGNQAENFSVGANLGLIMMLAMGQQFDPIEEAVKGLHLVNQRLKYCSKPVVSAPFAMTLGGGAEVAMATDAICASSELYIGLVELGAGLIPGGGGTKEMLVRHLENIPAEWPVDRFPFIQKAFENIGMAKVSLSAYEGRDMQFLRKSDRIVMNRDHQIYEAKRMAIGMYEGGYKPPSKPDCLVLPGRAGYSTFEMGLYNMRMGGYVSDHDKKIAMKLANVLTGGDIQPNSKVTEDYILELEREAFMSLVGEPLSIARMQSLLTTGKPLRN